MHSPISQRESSLRSSVGEMSICVGDGDESVLVVSGLVGIGDVGGRWKGEWWLGRG